MQRILTPKGSGSQSFSGNLLLTQRANIRRLCAPIVVIQRVEWRPFGLPFV